MAPKSGHDREQSHTLDIDHLFTELSAIVFILAGAIVKRGELAVGSQRHTIWFVTVMGALLRRQTA